MSSGLDEAKALLVRRWGEMGGYWGISRSMAEIHALLFVTGRPLCTDDVMAQLHVSRGNASMNLRALVDWGLVRREHKLGDRKEYFVADSDVWHMFETIMRERRRREVEPIIATIDRCREMVTAAPTSRVESDEAREFRDRLEELKDFLTTMGTLFELVLRFGGDGTGQLAQLLGQPAGGRDTLVRTATVRERPSAGARGTLVPAGAKAKKATGARKMVKKRGSGRR